MLDKHVSEPYLSDRHYFIGLYLHIPRVIHHPKVWPVQICNNFYLQSVTIRAKADLMLFRWQK